MHKIDKIETMWYNNKWINRKKEDKMLYKLRMLRYDNPMMLLAIILVTIFVIGGIVSLGHINCSLMGGLFRQ